MPSLVAPSSLSAQIVERVAVEASPARYPFFTFPLPPISNRAVVPEVMIQRDLDADQDEIDETVYNLRATGYFDAVEVVLDSVDVDRAVARVVVLKRSGGAPLLLSEVGGGVGFGGVGALVRGLGDADITASFSAGYREEFNIGVQLRGDLLWRRVLGTPLALRFDGRSNDQYREATAAVELPVWTTADHWGAGLELRHGDGIQYALRQQGDADAGSFTRQRTQGAAWLRWADKPNRDRVYATAQLRWDNTSISDPRLLEALSNSGSFLFGFGSLAFDHDADERLRLWYRQSDSAIIGSWGQAIIGRVFSINSGEAFYYVGGSIAQSKLVGSSLVLSGYAAAGTGMEKGTATNTALETKGGALYRVSEHTTLAARFIQSTVWNWRRWRQLVLDHESGIRGLAANDRAADNRIMTSIELQHSLVRTQSLELGGAAFVDIGAAWEQDIPVSKAQISPTAGAELTARIPGLSSQHVVRLNAAWDIRNSRIGGVGLSFGLPVSIIHVPATEAPRVVGAYSQGE